jgi:hypothetical protein
MEEAVQDGRRQHVVVEHLAPIRKAFVAGHDQAAPLVAADEQAEEETGFVAPERQIAEFIEDQQPRMRQLL